MNRTAITLFTRPVGSGGAAGLPPPNYLLKCVDFVSEKGCKVKVLRMEIQTRIYSRKLPESIKIGISFDVILV